MLEGFGGFSKVNRPTKCIRGLNMTTLTGAVICEQGVTFAVALVKNHVLNSQSKSDEMIQYVSRALGCPLVVLLGESSRTVRGNRQDIVNFVANLSRSRIPWRKYQLRT